MAFGVVARYLPVASIVGGLAVFLRGKDSAMQMNGHEPGLGEMLANAAITAECLEKLRSLDSSIASAAVNIA